MDLENRTTFSAGLFRTIIDDTRLAAAVICRVTYDLEGGRAIPSADQPWIVSFPPRETEYGLLESDECFYRGGVDVFVFGHACTPRGTKVERLEVSVSIGKSFHRSVVVTGDRSWRKSGRKLVASDPVPFSKIPLRVEYAFGGKGKWDGLETMYPDNPDGKGYYLDEEAAIDQPLPNIEEPDALVRAWDDRPPPAGVAPCPLGCSLRFHNGVKMEEDGTTRILPTFFNSAFPRMIAREVLPGDPVRIEGVSPDGPISFLVPDTDLWTRIRFDDELAERKLAIDQVGIEADRVRMFITYRYPFRYVLYPLQRRSCELYLQAGSSPGRS
jgi:hypothetical protein